MQPRDASLQLEWQRRVVADPRWVGAILPATIVLATFLAYVDTLALGFVFDDHVLIVTNDSIRSWRYFPSYFASHIWSFRYPHLLANYYRPFFLTWLRLNDMLFGLRPWGWHLTSMVAHIAVTYLVYRLCLKLAGNAWVAGAAGLLFGLHPVHAEAVADITSIQEPLSTVFMLAALLAFIRSREPAASPGGLAAAWHGHPAREGSWPRWPWHKGWLVAALAFSATALLSKESGMVLPILIGGYVWIYGEVKGGEAARIENSIPFTRRVRDAAAASIPFWIVVLLYVLARMRALKGFAHVITPLSKSQIILTIPSALLFYLRLMIWPVGLSCYYDTPYVSAPNWNKFVLPALFMTAVGAMLVFWYGRTRSRVPEQARVLAFAGLWMVLTLLPVLNFRFLPEGEIAHDRYVYLPSVGFAILVAIALGQLWSAIPKLFHRPAWLLVSVLVMVTGYATARQNLFWSDDLTLNYRAHEIAPRNVSALTSLAAAVSQHGMDGAAMALYQQALAIQPDFWRANVNLAYLYYAHGNYAEAVRFFARASNADASDGDQFLYLGMSLLRLGQLTEAEKSVRTALVVRPQGKNYHLGLGLILKQEGRLPEAKQEIAAELAVDPQSVQARSLLEDVTRQITQEADKPAAGQAPKKHLPDIR